MDYRCPLSEDPPALAGSTRLLLNAALFTTPKMNDDKRYPCASASRVIALIDCWSKSSIRRPTA